MYNNTMKRLSLDPAKTKRGMASFYVVIFATILFGVVTVSFIRIILSEATQSSNDDLSRSAYDAAIAGVEDAKTAVNRYYACLQGGGNAGDCDSRAYETLFSHNCTENGIGVARYLYGDGYNGDNPDNVEVKLQQTAPTGNNADNSSDQAYTCVILSDTVPDYRGTLSKDTPSKAVPLGVYSNNSTEQPTRIQDVKKVRFQWYSQLNEGDRKDFVVSPDGQTLQRADLKTIPPTVALTLIRTKKDMSIDDFHTPNNGADYSTVVLMPTDQSAEQITSEIPYSALQSAGNINKWGNNEPFRVVCTTNSEFACSVDFTGLSFDSTDSVILIVSLPYADTTMDFATTLYDAEGKSVDFVGVQVQVDSTGRTNQLVRRVESRLDPADLFFPYPQYELFLDGGEGQSLDKNFWITANCWHTHPLDSTSGENDTSAKPKICPNNGKIE